MIKKHFVISLIASLLLSLGAISQPPPPPSDPSFNNPPVGGGAPTGNGTLLLIVLAGMYGGTKIRNAKKDKSE